jgi:small-conductance mechanosensitive channel
MNGEMQLVWTELLSDLSSAAILWQLAVIAASCASAWIISGLLRAYVMKHTQESWKVGIGGFNRVLFPLSSVTFVYIGMLVLQHWQHISLLTLVTKLLWAMAAIRLVVYGLRYIFNPDGWVRATEHIISRTIWVILALHLSGFWPDLVSFLEDLSFHIGKTQVNLWLIIQALLTVLLTLFVSLSLSRMLENRLMRADKVDINVRVVLTKLIRIALSLVAILTGLSAVGFDITLLSVFGGALGVGLGFGLQKIASNYVSGFIILLDDSMHIGDVVTVDSHYGVVSELRFRYMVLRKLDGTEVVIPHETLMTNAVINHSYTSRNSKVNMSIQVSYESDLEQAMALIKGAANAHARVLEDPPVDVQVKGFGESGIDLNLAFWIPDPEEGSAGLQSEIYLEIWRQFKLKGVVIPYPQREVRLLGGKPTEKPQVVSPEKPVGSELPPNWDDVR